MLDCGFAVFLYWGLSPFFKAQCLPKIEKGLCLAGCHVVAQTQSYYLVYIWGSLDKFQGGGWSCSIKSMHGVVLKSDVLRHCFAVFCTVCMQAMTHSVGNVPSQEAVKLVVVGGGFVEQCWLKNGVNWGNGFAISDANSKIVPHFPD